MIRLFSVVLVSAFLMMLGSAIADNSPPKTFQYRVRIPASQNSCSAEAQLLGQKFFQTTGIQPLKSECKGVIPVTFDKKDYQLFSLAVSYAAPAALTPYSALLGIKSQSGPPQGAVGGFYDTFESCVNDIPSKETQFEILTKLRVVSSVCEVAPYGRQFFLQMNSFGKPAQTLFIYHPDYVAAPDLNIYLEELITKLGGTVVAQKDAAWFYFAPSSVYIRHQNFGGFKTKEMCELQIWAAQDIFFRSGSVHTYLICDNSFYLRGMADGSSWISGDMGGSSDTYYSMQECLNDKERVLNDLRSSGRKPLGAICRPEPFTAPEIYRVEIYETLRAEPPTQCVQN